MKKIKAWASIKKSGKLKPIGTGIFCSLYPIYKTKSEAQRDCLPDEKVVKCEIRYE